MMIRADTCIHEYVFDGHRRISENLNPYIRIAARAEIIRGHTQHILFPVVRYRRIEVRSRAPLFFFFNNPLIIDAL